MSASEKSKPLKKRKYCITTDVSHEFSAVTHSSTFFSTSANSQEVILLNSPPQTPPANTNLVHYYNESSGSLPNPHSPYDSPLSVYPSPGQSPMNITASQNEHLPNTPTFQPHLVSCGPHPGIHSHVPSLPSSYHHYSVSELPETLGHSSESIAPLNRHISYSVEDPSSVLVNLSSSPLHGCPVPSVETKGSDCPTTRNYSSRQQSSINQQPEQETSSNSVIPKSIFDILQPALLSEITTANKSAEERRAKKKSEKEFVYFVNGKPKSKEVLSRILKPRKCPFPAGEDITTETNSRKRRNKSVETINLENYQYVQSSNNYNMHDKKNQEHEIKRPIPTYARCLPSSGNSFIKIAETATNISNNDISQTVHRGLKQQRPFL